MLCLTQVAALLLLLGCFTVSQADDSPIQLTFSTNTSTTTVPVGQPFTVRCDLTNFEPANDTTYRVMLCSQGECYFAKYLITVAMTANATAVQIRPFEAVHNHYHNLSISTASYNLSRFTWTLVPHAADVRLLRCNLDNYGHGLDVHSNPAVLTFRASSTTAGSTSPSTMTPSITISTNATALLVKEPFSIHCNVANLVLKKFTHYSVWLRAHLCDTKKRLHPPAYHITVNEAREARISADEPLTAFGITASIASSNHSSFAWTVVADNGTICTLQCRLYADYHSHRLSKHSKHLNIILKTERMAKPSTPSLTFSTNATKVDPGQPFTATCTISDFSPTSSGYRVRFYQQSNDLLATFEVDGSSGRAMLTGERKAKVQVHAGARFALPNFDLVVRQNSSHAAHYWCELEDLSGQALIISSAKWPNTPLVDFYSSTLGSERIGNCSISGFEPAGKVYSVQFFSQFGPDEENLMATYNVKPNSPLEFLSEPHRTEFTSITHGNVSSLNFQVHVKSSHYSGSWFCVLLVGSAEDPDNSNNEKYSSNAVAF